MQRPQVSLSSCVVVIAGIIALVLTIFAITQSTNYRIHADKGAVLLLSGRPLEVSSGEKLNVSLDIQTNSLPIQTVFINLIFPTNKVELLSTDFSHSPIDVDAGTYTQSGYLTIGRSTGFPQSGTVHIATLHFLAKDNVSLKDIQSVPGTSILNTENRNIYLQTVTSTVSMKEDSPSIIQFMVNMVEGLFGKRKY